MVNRLWSLAVLLACLLFSSALHFPGFRRHSHHPQVKGADAKRRFAIELDERLLPITATTTVVVDMTRTQTVWVEATGQVVFPGGGGNEDGGQSHSASVSVSDHSSASSSSASQPTSMSEASASASSSATISGSASDSASGSSSSSAESTSLSASDEPSSGAPSPTHSSSIMASGSSSSGDIIASTSSARASSASGTRSSRADSASVSRSRTSALPVTTSSSAVSDSSISAESASSSASASASASGSVSSSPSSSADSSSSASLFSSEASSSSSAVSTSSSISSSSAGSTILSPSATLASTSSASPSPSSGTGTLNNLPPVPDTLMAGYWADWAAGSLPPEAIDFTKFDIIDYAFALPTPDAGLQFTAWDSSGLLNRLVAAAHSNGKRVKLSIGGWTGSADFSNIVASSSKRATFIKNIMNAFWAYKLDGIDIDWEYPGTGGAGGNAVSPNDSNNFLTFLTELRAALPDGALITLATQVWPFAGTNGAPMSDVSGFAAVIDWILIMNYDIWGSSSTPGPNAPLSNACGNSTQPLANAYAAVASWTAAGMPAKQITLGVPAYGYLQQSWATSLIQKRDRFPLPPGRRQRQDKRAGLTVQNDNGGTTDGQVNFSSLVAQGALVPDGQGNYAGAGGFFREWDSCSSTPFLKSWDSGQIITYDDTESLSLKGQFAAQAGLRGCNVWSMDGDLSGSGFPLISATRSGLGI